ncbi:phage terminase small subunit [Streptococcus pyogenes]|uniref:phage terminase small subunit n=1 Tax=Streptococcus pyogenes TaxID=1314 RepID=UPI001FF78640|nr:phage terminase small subunit [Streptococcus pyogenes]
MSLKVRQIVSCLFSLQNEQIGGVRLGRARDPNRDKAFELYKQNNGDITNRKLGEMLGVPEKTISVWKLRDKWKECSTTKNRSTAKRPRGAPKGNKNGKGGTLGNTNALKHGLFAKYLPKGVYEITQDIESKPPIDILWDNITLTYANLLHAQKILHVTDQQDHANFITSEGKAGIGYERHTSWDRQTNALTAIARVQAELRNMIKTYDELTRSELVTDEQRTRIELLKVKLDAEKGSKPDTSLMEALLDAVEGGD